MADIASSQPAFVEVATEGAIRIGRAEPLTMRFSSFRDPEEAFKTAFFMWSLWCSVTEDYTSFSKFRAPKHIEAKTFAVYADPLQSLTLVLTEALALAKRIERHGTLEYLGKTYDTTGITLRIQVFQTMFDVRTDTNIEILHQKWRALGKEEIPTFSRSLTDDTIVGMHSALITQ